jgi:hypothetical protein
MRGAAYLSRSGAKYGLVHPNLSSRIASEDPVAIQHVRVLLLAFSGSLDSGTAELGNQTHNELGSLPLACLFLLFLERTSSRAVHIDKQFDKQCNKRPITARKKIFREPRTSFLPEETAELEALKSPKTLAKAKQRCESCDQATQFRVGTRGPRTTCTRQAKLLIRESGM